MQKTGVKNLLACFEYIKKYCLDIFDSLQALLEVLLVCKNHPDIFKSKDEESFFCYMRQMGIEDSLLKDLRPSKILKFLSQDELKGEVIEEFFHIIAQQKTHNKLYDYSTPMEINRLLIGILDLKDGERLYNPCYGMGSVFLSKMPKIELFGEELDSRLALIANLIVRLCGIKVERLCVNDLLKSPSFLNEDGFMKFDKILCNPPMYAHMGIEFLKKDARFALTPALAKRYPELVFLIHSLSHLKDRGVFIVRNQVLQKGSNEAKVRQMLCEAHLISAIIELPKNIFPLQSYDFSIIVIAPDSREILHINANDEHFYHKDGKYNRLSHLDELLDIFKKRKITPYSGLTSLENLDPSRDLRASSILESAHKSAKKTLKTEGFRLIRGQRVYGGSFDVDIDFYDVGVADFKALGYSTEFENKRSKGNFKKIIKYALHPYDILLPLRGICPKVAILGDIKDRCVANGGLVVLRCDDYKKSIGLYCYFFSYEGEEALRQIYEKSGVLDLERLMTISLPDDLPIDLMDKILDLSQRMNELENEIIKLKNMEK